MFIIGGTLVSEDIIKEDFICNLSKCKGACCEKGDFGAPVTASEIANYKKDIEKFKLYLPKNNIDAIKKQGISTVDEDGELVTSLVQGKECVFAFNEEGIWKCSIEKAWEEGKSKFQKPQSCHLYPIRLSKIGEYIALNYDRWEICSDACLLGKEMKVPVFKFLKSPLILVFGEDWYKELEEVASYFSSK
jgi:hypothetical protein